ncbi:hypothetical protein ACGFNU_14190 [Spirillospora sp. NPDC048911]|uniref:hypothetical protein n=1 Tax=Spirillospora sp. NPDC048911 TaxID=3364527 RepID=UPI003710F0B8
MMRSHLAVVAAAAALAGAATGYLLSPSPSTAGTETVSFAPVRTRHVALNMPAGDRAKAAALGYDLFDVDPDADEIASLPKGAQALLWVGNTTCGGFGMTEEAFADAVRRLARNPRVYGWYLSDEPNPAECPDIVAQIRRRADVIHRYAPGQKAFASLTDWTMTPLKPSATHLDLIGLDPYPCRTEARGCDLRAIDRMVGQAVKAGFPKSMMVPVFQTFGQSCNKGDKNWRLPTASQLRAILGRWNELLPRPAFDISYSWGRQSEWACPTLADAPALQAIMKEHNNRRLGPAPSDPDQGTPPKDTPSQETPSKPAETPSPCTTIKG